MPRRKPEVRINLVRKPNDDCYVPMESWEILALGDKVRIEKARTDGKMHVTFYTSTVDL